MDMGTIAKRENLADRHVRFLAPLAYLSPPIIEAIAEGEAPADQEVEPPDAALITASAHKPGRSGLGADGSHLFEVATKGFERPPFCDFPYRRFGCPLLRIGRPRWSGSNAVFFPLLGRSQGHRPPPEAPASRSCRLRADNVVALADPYAMPSQNVRNKHSRGSKRAQDYSLY
jgi:hypothetical protein